MPAEAGAGIHKRLWERAYPAHFVFLREDLLFGQGEAVIRKIEK
jgi:hypothetical protein